VIEAVGASSFLHIETQSNFPASDLTDANAEVLPYVLGDKSGINSHAKYLRDYQQPLYSVAYSALRFSDKPADYSTDEYRAFTRGFATFEAIASVVRPVAIYDTAHAALIAQWNLMQYGSFADVELARRSKNWPDERPNVHDVVIIMGERRGETIKQLHARVIGAQIAFELQRPLLDAA
jgi:hypothetical protein